MQLASDGLVVLPRLRCADGECRRVMFRDVVVPLVARIAEGHDVGLPLQYGAQREEDERRSPNGQSSQPGTPALVSRLMRNMFSA